MHSRLTGRTVLIVEDDPLIASEIQTTFERAGAAALAVRTIAQARLLIEQDGLSAAVLDFGVGDDAAQRLCHGLTERKVPFVLHSAYTHTGAASSKGTYIPKPASSDIIIRAVIKLLGDKRHSMPTQPAGNEHSTALSSSDFAILQPHELRLQANLRRSEDLIAQSRTRIAEHAVAMERINPNSPELYALSRDVHVNLEAGLQFLMHSRAMWARELRYLERRKADAMGALATDGPRMP